MRSLPCVDGTALGWILVNDNLVWIDCEMTGLDLKRDALIEVAVLVTDKDLNILGDGVDVFITPSAESIEQMGDFVREMHTKSGLLEQVARDGIPMADAEKICLDYVREHCSTQRKAPLAGNTIGTDRMFLARDMPQLEGWVHYRNVDVSSIKELAKRWFPKAQQSAPVKAGNHRALADIQESIEELRYYREAVFVPAPGPDTAAARQIARRHQGAITGFGTTDA